MARLSPLAALLVVAGCVMLVRQAAFLVGGGAAAARGRGASPRVARAAEGEGSSSGDRVQLRVLSPEGVGITETVSEVILPSASGQLGVLANHAPMMSALDIGVLRYKKDGAWKPLVTYGGFASVDSNQLSILVNDFETVDGINLEEAKKDMEAATSALEKAESKKDKLDATQSVKKAAARLQAAMFSSKKEPRPAGTADIWFLGMPVQRTVTSA
eukprot:CAMPEP_0115416612 /NCGR_PEP_ID=MMETSP0271-20121206/23704_1 /TAXON_ID=71861 /ORGANISM="Scrippsiella trochoidea, Strain CCMP3099" /LENGTH=214 /DNA_ID=CAMNT_0002840985 /DNA_START=73 /DNA_END=714 /DNA_ORIENTATION=+